MTDEQKNGTTYAVLREEKAEGGDAFYFVGKQVAPSANAAIKALVEKGGTANPQTDAEITQAVVDPSGRYVAVPMRSFVVVEVKIETKPTITVG